MSRWCILRTSGGQTLPLARSLRGAGFDVWTPARTIRRVIGHGSRKGARLTEQDVPILPTFVFARDAQLLALAAAASVEVSPHPAFSIFRHSGRIPLVGDAEVRGLQEEEERAAVTIRAMREAESRAAAEEIRVAALREESERRRAARNLERRRINDLRAKGRQIAPETEVSVAGMLALAGVTGVIEESDDRTARVRFGSQTWKIDTWRLAAVIDQASRGLAA